MAGGIVLVELEDVFDVRLEAHNPSFQSLEHHKVKGCIDSLSLQYNLKMDDSSDVKEDNQHSYGARRAYVRFLGFGRRLCLPSPVRIPTSLHCEKLELFPPSTPSVQALHRPFAFANPSSLSHVPQMLTSSGCQRLPGCLTQNFTHMLVRFHQLIS